MAGPAGVIINISSINAVVAIADQVSLLCVQGRSEPADKGPWRLALAPHGIRVNAIGPGSIMTEMLTAVNSDSEAKQRMFVEDTGPAGSASRRRLPVWQAFLASDDAAYVTGQTVYGRWRPLAAELHGGGRRTGIG